MSGRERTYRRRGEVSRTRNDILNATFLESRQRPELYEECRKKGLNPFFLWCFADPETLKARVTLRQETGNDISDAHGAVLKWQLRTVEEPSELSCFRVMRLNTSEDRPDTVKRALGLFL
jgi:predicted kinase